MGTGYYKMEKQNRIKFVSIAVAGSENFRDVFYAVDDKGRIWERTQGAGPWVMSLNQPPIEPK